MAGPYTFPQSGVSTIATGVAGHDSATDGAGGIMIVYYAANGSNYDVYASLGANAVWGAGAQIDAAAASAGFTTPSPNTTLWPQGSRPGVAYVGSGRFQAIWVGISASTLQTQLYSNLYDPANGGWQGAELVGSSDTYTTRPHPQLLTVFGNGDGNAGYALNKIYVNGTLFPETAGVRVTELNRWQEDDDWVGAETFTGTTCFNSLTSSGATAGSGNGADCTHRPVGVMLPSGVSFVFFQAQDNYASGTVPGNRRVAVAAFQ